MLSNSSDADEITFRIKQSMSLVGGASISNLTIQAPFKNKIYPQFHLQLGGANVTFFNQTSQTN